jgi:hypothetical protein
MMPSALLNTLYCRIGLVINQAYESGRISTADLRAPATLVQLLSVLKILFTFFTIHGTLMRRVDCTEAGSLNKSSCLAPALGVTKFIINTYDFGHSLLCYLSRT